MKWLLPLFFLFACESPPKLTTFEGIAMHVPYKIQIGKALKGNEIENVQEIIGNTFAHIDQVYNNWNPDSEISSLGKLKAYQKITLSKELAVMLHKVDHLYRISQGRFDITVGALSRLYKEGKTPYLSTGWDTIHLENNTLWKEHDATLFDLCAIAKGHAVDLLANNLKIYENLYIEWGGEIKVLGLHPTGRQWQIAIKNTKTTLSLSNVAIATSGDYEQFWEKEGVSYCHIIDPKTKTPLIRKPGSIASATIVAPSCALADALATIMLLFETRTEGEEWLKTHFPEAQYF